LNIVWLDLVELVQNRQRLGWFALLKQRFRVEAAKSRTRSALRILAISCKTADQQRHDAHRFQLPKHFSKSDWAFSLAGL